MRGLGLAAAGWDHMMLNTRGPCPVAMTVCSNAEYGRQRSPGQPLPQNLRSCHERVDILPPLAPKGGEHLRRWISEGSFANVSVQIAHQAGADRHKRLTWHELRQTGRESHGVDLSQNGPEGNPLRPCHPLVHGAGPHDKGIEDERVAVDFRPQGLRGGRKRRDDLGDPLLPLYRAHGSSGRSTTGAPYGPAYAGGAGSKSADSEWKIRGLDSTSVLSVT